MGKLLPPCEVCGTPVLRRQNPLPHTYPKRYACSVACRIEYALTHDEPPLSQTVLDMMANAISRDADEIYSTENSDED